MGLRETHDTSNYILLRILIEIHLFQQGLQGICMDPARLPEMLGLMHRDIHRLRKTGLVHLPPPTPQPEKGIDYVTLRETYTRMLAEGPVSTQTEIALHLGVSRVWVSRVLGGIKSKEG